MDDNTKKQIVIAKKGPERLHLIALENGENLSTVGCGNALGQSMPTLCFP